MYLYVHTVHKVNMNLKLNGLMEKWNGTLKKILNGLCVDSQICGTDICLPFYLLIGKPTRRVWDFLHESFYGRNVRGPMQILKELCFKDGEQPETKTAYQYILNLRSRLEDTDKLAQ